MVSKIGADDSSPARDQRRYSPEDIPTPHRRGGVSSYGQNIRSDLGKKAWWAGRKRAPNLRPLDRHLIEIQPVDLIVSVYAMGWTRDPQALFQNLWSYLKPSGRLIWSWGHQLFDKVQYENERFVLRQSYFDETPRFTPNWGASNGVYMQHHTIATWFRYQTESGFLVRDFLEPEPLSTVEAPDDPARYYSASKAKHVPGTIIFVCEKP